VDTNKESGIKSKSSFFGGLTPTKPKEKEMEEQVTVEETIEALKNKVGPITLESRWRNALALKGKFVKPLTTKEKAQLKKLGKYLGEKQFEVLDWVMENWSKFASGASSASGSKSYPTEPNIGYLLVHHAYAVNYMSSLSDLTKPLQEIAKPVIVPTETVVPYKPSPEEVSALLEEL
jgi:hypothetical protein